MSPERAWVDGRSLWELIEHRAEATPDGLMAVDPSGRQLSFREYREAARRVGAKHGATWVPFHEDFVAALDEAPAEYWAADGVHPSKAGAARMAKAWLAAVRG